MARTKQTSKKVKAKSAAKKITVEAFIAKNRESYPKSSWVVYTTPEGRDGKRRQPRVFNGGMSRDEVRGQYAKSMGVTKEETRSRRVINW